MRRLAFICTLVLLLAVSHVHAATGKCRALAMSGGGDKAAYESGVLRGLLNSLPAEETMYNVVTGISAGSTLSAAFSVFPLGQEEGAVELIFQIIADLNKSSVFRDWPAGETQGTSAHSSRFDSTPLRTLFTSVLRDRQLARDRVTCQGAANVRTGLFERFCDPRSTQDVVDSTLASSAIPGVFIAQTIQGETYVDGGTLVNVDVLGAVEQCVALGFAPADIVVDVVECGGDSRKDFRDVRRAFPLVRHRYRIRPSQPLPGSGIDFNRTQMLWMQELGERDARNAVRSRPGRLPDAHPPAGGRKP